jgi:hypothetical protein
MDQHVTLLEATTRNGNGPEGAPSGPLVDRSM